MSIACCDPTRLPRANPAQKEGSVILPNKVTLKSRAWDRFPACGHPFVVIPVGRQAGRIWIFPGRSGTGTAVAALQDEGAYSREWGAVCHAPGDWWYFYDGPAAIDAVQVDAYNDAAMRMLGEDYLAGYNAPTHSFVVQDPADTLALAANPLRRYALFVNDSAQKCYLALGAPAALNAGIPLPVDADYELSGNALWTGEVRVIWTAAGGATDKLLVTEGV